MTQPKDAHQTDKGRVYRWKGDEYPSVTSVIGVLDKPALVPAARKIQAEVILDNLDHYAALIERVGFDKARLQASRDARAVWDKKTEQGTRLHEAVEAMVAGRFIEITDDLTPWMTHLDKWLVENTPEILYSEVSVFSRAGRYAGTVDLIMRLDDLGVTLCDLKSGTSVWPEVALQLSAYRHAEFMGRDGQELPMPIIDACAVLHLTEKGCDLVLVRNDETVYRSFLALREVWSWKYEIAPTVLP